MLNAGEKPLFICHICLTLIFGAIVLKLLPFRLFAFFTITLHFGQFTTPCIRPFWMTHY